MNEARRQEDAPEHGGAFVPHRLSPADEEELYRRKVMSLAFEVNELSRQLNLTRADLQYVEQQESLLRSSASVRIVQQIHSRLQRLLPPNSRRGRYLASCRRGVSLWFNQGTLAALHQLFTKLTASVSRFGRGPVDAMPSQSEDIVPGKCNFQDWIDYQEWVALVEPRELVEAAHHAGSLANRPRISVIMPVYNVDRRLLQAALQSVRDQLYDNWELCVCDDGSTSPDVRPTLLEAAGQDPRIKVVFSEKNGGIAAASNRALELATGAFVALLDHDDELAPYALYHVAKLLNVYPDAEVIYSDEDKINMSGGRYHPFLKPDWSPDLLRSCNYLCHLTVLRTCRVRELGGFRPGFEGGQDYDLFLRVIEQTTKIHHIPKVLYHWRACPGSTGTAPSAKMNAYQASRLALEEHLERCGISAKVTEGCGLGRWRVQYKIHGDPRVCIIVPSGGKVDLLDQCLRAVVGNTDYRNFELLIIDNSKGEKVRSYFPTITKLWPHSGYLDCRGLPFNFSALNNKAVRSVQAPLVLFLNDDTIPINGGWLEAMIEHAQRPEVGAVGCKLLFPSGDIQHAGVVMGISGTCDHVFRNMAGDPLKHPGYFDLPHMIRNVSAVTGACLMTRREVFCEVGGFNEVQLPIAFQDIDLCLKIRARGHLVICTPHAQLFHLESQSKREGEKMPESSEVNYMHQQWADVIARDPYYHPNLARTGYDCSLEMIDIRIDRLKRLSVPSKIAARAA